MTRKDALLLALVTALALALRLGWVLAVPTKPVGDFAMYLESATYLAEHGELDHGFIYMPGYVILCAAVIAAGGGLVACKLLGVFFGSLCAAAAFIVARKLFDGATALLAGLACALWPVGVALASVTGTDMPAAALIMGAAACLVALGERRPLWAAATFGAVMGLAGYVRAVAVPLAGFSAFYWVFRRARLGQVLSRSAIAICMAVLVLLPWGLRNKQREGAFFLTDTHGGITALVGSNPNWDGVWKRSLNEVFFRLTGYTVLGEPHRESDAAAYELAKQWAAFEPAYAAGLVGTKAGRLLMEEHGLLYWPLYRQGVLRGPTLAWFAARRAEFETLVDWFWFALVGAAAAGIGLALVRRHWEALSLLPLQLALIGIYAVYFAEPRYRLPIEVMAFPLAASTLTWTGRLARGAWRHPAARREIAAAIVGAAVVLAGWPALMGFEKRLRDEHRWALTLCKVGPATHACKWRRADPPRGPSPIRGANEGVGLRLPATAQAGTLVAAELSVDLPAGRYRVTGTVEPPTVRAAAKLRFSVDGAGVRAPPAQLLLEETGGAAPGLLEGTLQHHGGTLRLTARVEITEGGLRSESTAEPTVWLSGLVFDPVSDPRP